jgi:glycerol dehydrogenase-like iron-containing ADH family enzyme
VSGEGFPTVFGRGLVAEIPRFVHRPFLVVTMADIWPKLAPDLSDGLAGVHFVETLELSELETIEEALPSCESVVGLGGGRAIDVAKFVSWKRRLPLFQVPTAMTVNAPFGHRAGLRVQGVVRYLGYVVPEAVYVDYDVIQSAPPDLNRSGVGDILCYHTAHRDWEIARDHGMIEPEWPYDAGLVAEARGRLDSVLDHLDDIRAVSDLGVRTLMSAHRWGGTTFHDSGWNPRHIEGMEHFFFYNLEHITGKHFIHGQPVGLGIYIGSLLQENAPEAMLEALHRAGVDIRPEAMGVTWEDVESAVQTLPSFVNEAGLWFTAASALPIPPDLVERARLGVMDRYGTPEVIS